MIRIRSKKSRNTLSLLGYYCLNLSSSVHTSSKVSFLYMYLFVLNVSPSLQLTAVQPSQTFIPAPAHIKTSQVHVSLLRVLRDNDHGITRMS